MTRTLFLIVLALAAVQPALAADRPPPLKDFVRDTVFAAVAKPDSAPLQDTERQFLSFVGREDLVAKSSKPRPACTPEVVGGKPVDVIDTIVKRSVGTRLVIINEAHDDPQGRAFIMDLLARLHDAGFTHYAAETFFPKIQPSSPPWPREEDGFYSSEPVFGELIRRARTLGFTFIPYEAMSAKRSGDMAADIAAREEGQARNLNDHFVKAVPAARAFVHVGYGHVYEVATWRSPGKLEAMAARLKRMSGVDPLTIDQTIFRSPTDTPVVCADHEHLTDLSVALPAVSFSDGRPTWRRARGQKPVAVPSELRSPDHVVLVEARYAGEPDEAVPADRLLLRPGETLSLLLPKGRFRVQAWTREDGWSAEVSVTVD